MLLKEFAGRMISRVDRDRYEGCRALSAGGRLECRDRDFVGRRRADNGHIGVSYVLREDLEAGCSIFPYGREIVGLEAVDIAEWAISGGDSLQRGIGIASLSAASRAQSLDDCDSPERPFGMTLRKTDRVGMIGLIAPVEKMLRPRVNDIFVFDKGISLLGAMIQYHADGSPEKRFRPVTS